ncbi:hypothetical protein BOTBODRAFT_142584 [Botryobasidium botryosum FD-172 SS1]|uniref:HhH-GPD domain-containing protein n=1 Tax=Botryobasidium botryosum (strain FD-172 SS1) TaxID=930990 RepID=A0A067MWE2_BOTB1|nr:hypothetical protein BOTBODRAFT_142584 [Botryobasidium botryosum FD-172 SS1]
MARHSLPAMASSSPSPAVPPDPKLRKKKRKRRRSMDDATEGEPSVPKTKTRIKSAAIIEDSPPPSSPLPSNPDTAATLVTVQPSPPPPTSTSTSVCPTPTTIATTAPPAISATEVATASTLTPTIAKALPIRRVLVQDASSGAEDDAGWELFRKFLDAPLPPGSLVVMESEAPTTDDGGRAKSVSSASSFDVRPKKSKKRRRKSSIPEPPPPPSPPEPPGQPESQPSVVPVPTFLKYPSVSGYVPQKIAEHLRGAKPQLIQELVAHDTWKMIIAVTLLNKTSGKAAIPVFWNLITTWPTPKDLSQASASDLTALLQPLGLQNIRASRFIQFSTQYLTDPPSPSNLRKSKAGGAEYPPTEISHLIGVGRYALDSYRIFYPRLKGGGAPNRENVCLSAVAAMGEMWPRTGELDEAWKLVLPQDRELRKYLTWRWAVEGYQWNWETGIVGRASAAYILSL